MRLSGRAPLLLFSLLFSASVAGQQESTQPRRDPEAIAVIERAVTALGGQVALSQVRDCVAAGKIEVPRGSTLADGNFVWKNADTEFRYEYPTVEGTEIFASGHGYPATLKRGRTSTLHGHMAEGNFPLHLPGVVLLRRVLDAHYSVVLVGPGVVAGNSVIRVRTSLDSDEVASFVTPQEWFFDVATGFPLRIEYRWPNNLNAAEFLRVAADFGDFRPVSGVMIPFRIANYAQANLVATFTLNSASLNAGLRSSDFDLHNGVEQ